MNQIIRVLNSLIVILCTSVCSYTFCEAQVSSESCNDVLELSTYWSRELYNGTCVGLTQGEVVKSEYDRKADNCKYFAQQTRNECSTGALDTPTGTHKITRTPMSLTYLKGCQLVTGLCTPRYQVGPGRYCDSKFKDGTCSLGSCLAPAQHLGFDQDNDGVPKCISGGIEREFGTGGCDCNESPYDCDDSNPKIGTSYPLDEAPIFAIRSIERWDPNSSSEPLNPMEQMYVTIETKSCIKQLTATVDIDPGNGRPISVGPVSFEVSPRVSTPGVLVGVVGTSDLIGNGWFNNVATENFDQFLIQATRQYSSYFPATNPPKVIVHSKSGNKSLSFGMTLCVPVVGTGPHRIAFVRSSQMKPYSTGIPWGRRSVVVAKHFWQYLFDSFSAVGSPFSANNSKFSLYADLATFEEVLNPNNTDKELIPNYLNLSCRNNFPVKIIESGLAEIAYTNNSNGSVIMHISATDPQFGFGKMPRTYDATNDINSTYYLAMAHELGHAFANLRDEYRQLGYGELTSIEPIHTVQQHYLRKNCAYPEHVSKAFFPPGNVLDPDRSYCLFGGAYRSTVRSIMENSFVSPPQFNVVSCTHIMAKIFGGLFKSYLTPCLKYDKYKIG